MKISLALFGLQDWFGGDFLPVIDLVKRADEKGIDQINVTDHVILSENLDSYPYGKFAADSPTYPFYEPITLLATLAGVTKNIRLSSGIVISPLRPAVLLAKQLTTLDVLSNGRIEIGIGVGWQREEYDASGIPWEKRFTRMHEQAQICKLLWKGGPSTFHGTTVDFDRIYCHPLPVQKSGIPIWYGVAPTEQNFQRIAEAGDGWLPVEQNPGKLRRHIDQLKETFEKHDRDPSTLAIRSMAMPHYGTHSDSMDDFKQSLKKPEPVSLKDTLVEVPALLDAGVNIIELFPTMFCKSAAEFDGFLDQVMEFKKSYER